MAANQAKLDALNEALAVLNKNVKTETGDNVIAKLGDRPRNVETISSGSLVLDSILGGGFAKGRIIEIYGPESSGKTTFALTAIANVQAEGGTAAFIDFENALDPKYAENLGVNIAELAVSQPDYAEQGLELVEKLASTGAVDIIVIDSVAALVPLAELENDLESQTIALTARLLSKSLRKLIRVANQSGTTIIMINQLRVAIGSYSPVGVPTDTTGGKALKFYASQRLEIKRGQQIKEGKTVVGVQTKFVVKKNKIAPPFLTGETIISFGKGINEAVELLEVAPNYGVILRPNNRTYVNALTGEVLGTSRADAITKLEEDPELLSSLQDALKDALEQARAGGEYSVTSNLTEESTDDSE